MKLILSALLKSDYRRIGIQVLSLVLLVKIVASNERNCCIFLWTKIVVAVRYKCMLLRALEFLVTPFKFICQDIYELISAEDDPWTFYSHDRLCFLCGLYWFCTGFGVQLSTACTLHGKVYSSHKLAYDKNFAKLQEKLELKHLNWI